MKIFIIGRRKEAEGIIQELATQTDFLVVRKDLQFSAKKLVRCIVGKKAKLSSVDYFKNYVGDVYDLYPTSTEYRYEVFRTLRKLIMEFRSQYGNDILSRMTTVESKAQPYMQSKITLNVIMNIELLDELEVLVKKENDAKNLIVLINNQGEFTEETIKKRVEFAKNCTFLNLKDQKNHFKFIRESLSKIL